VSLADRVRWLSAEVAGRLVAVTGVHCEAPLDLGDAIVWTAQVGAMRAALRVAGVGPVDAVVSGEGYGPRLAACFEGEHVAVDRAADPVSATLIRSNPTGHWDALVPSARAGLACRVVLLGAE